MWIIIKKIISYLSSNINSLGLSSLVFNRIVHPITECNPTKPDPCNQKIGLQSTVVSSALMWMDFGMSRIKNPRIINGWSQMKDVFGLWDFFAYFFLAAYAESNPGKEMDTYTAFLPLLLGAGSAAFISNKKVRDYLFYAFSKCIHFDESCLPPENIDSASSQHWIYSMMDAIWEACRGFAAGRGLIATCEKLHDMIWNTNHSTETGGLIARYATGGVSALLLGYIGWHYSAYAGVEKIFSPTASERAACIKSIIISLTTTVTFGILAGLELSEVDPLPRNILATNFGCLILANIIKSIYEKNEQSSEDAQLSVDEDYVALELNAPAGSNQYRFWNRLKKDSSVSYNALPVNSTYRK